MTEYVSMSGRYRWLLPDPTIDEMSKELRDILSKDVQSRNNKAGGS